VSGKTAYGLLRFDLSSLPTSATIYTATLQVTVFEIAVPGNVTLGARNLSGPWDEATITWGNRPANGAFLAQSSAPASQCPAIDHSPTGCERVITRTSLVLPAIGFDRVSL
jgi:hypothetical protein